ncbi:family S53 protease-like protein [Gautieria morchelliformis]|nr:family S53 protease-like protein [Gautieria morchelliformis]
MFAPFLCLTLFFLTLACAKPAPHNLVVHERRESIPDGFVQDGAAPSDTTLNLRLALVSNNMPGLEQALYDVSTPSSSQYGQHLSKEEVETFVAPSSDTTTAVNEWLSSNGLTASPISPAGDMLAFSIPVSKANQLFAADFILFTHQATGEQTIRTLSYSIPSVLQNHIAFVHPTTAFPVHTGGLPLMFTPIPQGTNVSANADPASCATQVTPACLQEQYGIPAAVPSQTASQLGVSGFIGEFAQKADLKSFLTTFRTDLSPETTFALQTLDGGSNPQSAAQAGIEANLDIEYTVGVAGGVPVTFISVGPDSTDGINGFLDIINALLNEASPPQVLTTSYGFNEPLIPPSIANSLCNAYMQLGARGVSVLFSSGDGGVSGSQPTTCTTFVPTFPSGCPFLTSVGATTGIDPETAASLSAGGFSNLFPRPIYQTLAVPVYLAQLGSTNAGLFNTTGRGFPDVSAQGENVVIFSGGEEGLVDGTSCSSPIFASTIALLNAELSAAGRRPLGFLNPFIYTHPDVFTDITTGSNPGCNTNGFPAKYGWDPVTGLGSPKFPALRAAVGLF